MSDLVERLRDLAPEDDDMPVTRRAMLEAATALEAKDKELAALREQYSDLLTERHIIYTNGKMWKARAENAERRVTELGASALAIENAKLKSWIDLHRGDTMSLSNEVDHFREGLADAERERDEARAALKPFAEAADDLDDSNQDRMEIWEAPCAMQITAGDLRRAARAITGKD